MKSSHSEAFAIALFVPDSAMRALEAKSQRSGIMPGDFSDLDFLPPAWWELSHTAKLGLVSSMGAISRI